MTHVHSFPSVDQPFARPTKNRYGAPHYQSTSSAVTPCRTALENPLMPQPAFDLCVIGGGSGGLVAAAGAAALGAKVTQIE